VNKNDVLVFSLLGYNSVEQTVLKAYKSLVISLKEKVSELNQITVVGMTEMQKKHKSSSLYSLDVKSNIVGKPITSLSQSLQGGVTGLEVRQASGLPGGDAATIKIRGISTLGNSDPLVLVDGVPMDMEQINPTTVQSVTILKDAAAAAIYGARAANGVILITTKRGEPGRVSVYYDGYYGFQRPSVIPQFVDAPTYMRMYNVAQMNAGGQPFYTDEEIQKTISGNDPIQYPNTDWAKEVINPAAAIMNHSLSVTGGNHLARFAITGDYMYQDGMMPVMNEKRYNLRANTSITLSYKFYF
jgi:TonB-dependent SusC/RagA subfamily outer membrane receptor